MGGEGDDLTKSYALVEGGTSDFAPRRFLAADQFCGGSGPSSG